MSARRPIWPGAVIVLTGLSLLTGMTMLFQWRFARGDVYPAYSSLRSDPLGTSVLYDALFSAGIRVERNVKELRRARFGAATVYVCGASWGWLEATNTEEARSLLEAVESGGRLVVALRARPRFSRPDDAAADAAAGNPAAGETEPVDDPPSESEGGELVGEEELATPSAPTLSAAWALEQVPLARAGLEAVEARRASMMAATFLPEKLAWHSRAALRAADPAWTVVYAVDDQAVMLERVLGRGAIVVMSDAFLLSNEAMLLEREPALLAWLQGASSSAVFEESHLGVREVPGVAALARRYGLGPAGLVLLAIVLLHVWRKASPLVPVETTDPDEGNILAGRDSAAGFVNLLRRTLPARALFPSCLAEYRHGSAWRRLNPELRGQLEELARSPVGHDPVEASVRAHRLLDRRFRAPPPSSP